MKNHIRAHHLLCLSFFRGKGYSREFVENMTKIREALRSNPVVTVVRQPDCICTACPNLLAGVCRDEEKVAEYDRQVLSRCGLSEGAAVPFRDLEQAVRQDILSCGKRSEICGNCQWDSLCRE